MQIKVLPTENSNVSIVQIPTSDLSLDSGLRLQMELLNKRGQINDRQYLEIGISDLPKFVVEGVEISAFEFLKQKALQQLGLEQDPSDAPAEPPPPLPDPMANYLKKDDASAIRFKYTPTPENRLISGENLQSALDQAIAILTRQQSQIALLELGNKVPIVSDTFNSVAGTSLDAHTPSTSPGGNKWVEQVGNWAIVNGSAKSDGVVGSLAWIESGISNASIECDVTISDVATPQGIIFRYVSNAAHWRATYSKSAAKWIIYEITTVGSSIRASIPATVTLGLTYKLKVIVSDLGISFYVNDDLKLSWTSLVNSTATKHGIYASSSQTTLFKNFKVVAL
jgi:hypothetical protein